MNKIAISGSLGFVFVLAGCSGNTSNLVDSCSGSYSCTDGTQTVSTELVKKGDACTAGQLTLNSDGTVGGIDNATWDGDTQKFEVCTGGACLTCTSTSSDPQPPKPTVYACISTHENATQCSALDPTDCTGVYCEDNADPSKCVDDTEESYSGGCMFEDYYTRTAVPGDCATYKAQNPGVLHDAVCQ